MWAVKGQWLHATPDIFQLCVLCKGYAGMPLPTSSDRVCCLMSIMACHARRRLTMCVVQGQLLHAKPDIVHPCSQSKGNDGMSYPSSSDRVCCPRDMMTVHTRCHPTVWVFQGLLCNPCPRSSDHLCCPSTNQACHTRHCSILCAVQVR